MLLGDKEKVAKIVELRNAGYTWHQVDQMVFPGTSKEQSKKKSPSWHLAKKYDAPAFTKTVSGMYTPTQVVTKIRSFKTPIVAAPEQTRITMADLGMV